MRLIYGGVCDAVFIPSLGLSRQLFYEPSVGMAKAWSKSLLAASRERSKCKRIQVVGFL